MSSTGTPSQFVHPSEAIHGDLGMITKEDVFMIISNSGETLELVQLIPSIKRKEIPIIGLIGKQGSTLAQESNIWLDTSVEKEACTLELAPTASTTVAMAIGDALAAVLMERNNISTKDFAINHPAGSLGAQLKTVEDIMITGKKIPYVNTNLKMSKALKILNEKKLGILVVRDKDKKTCGIITDGQIRRFSQKNLNFQSLPVKKIMTKRPISIDKNELAAKALSIMNNKKITSLIVINKKNKNKTIGVIHIHTILQSNIS